LLLLLSFVVTLADGVSQPVSHLEKLGMRHFFPKRHSALEMEISLQNSDIRQKTHLAPLIRRARATVVGFALGALIHCYCAEIRWGNNLWYRDSLRARLWRMNIVPLPSWPLAARLPFWGFVGG
jgi:hypothetical protein